MLHNVVVTCANSLSLDNTALYRLITEAAVCRCSIKVIVFKVSQNSLKITVQALGM